MFQTRSSWPYIDTLVSVPKLYIYLMSSVLCVVGGTMISSAIFCWLHPMSVTYQLCKLEQIYLSSQTLESLPNRWHDLSPFLLEAVIYRENLPHKSECMQKQCLAHRKYYLNFIYLCGISISVLRNKNTENENSCYKGRVFKDRLKLFHSWLILFQASPHT